MVASKSVCGNGLPPLMVTAPESPVEAMNISGLLVPSAIRIWSPKNKPALISGRATIIELFSASKRSGPK